MKRALAVLIGVVALSGCGGASYSSPPGAPVSSRPVPTPTYGPESAVGGPEIQAARNSDVLFAIFPAEQGTTACAIPDGQRLAADRELAKLPRLLASLALLATRGHIGHTVTGTCETSLDTTSYTMEPAPPLVVFRETWRCGRWTYSHSWGGRFGHRGQTPLQMITGAPYTPPARHWALAKPPAHVRNWGYNLTDFAKRFAGDPRFLAGIVGNSGDDSAPVHVNLVHAPQSIIDKLRAYSSSYGTRYVINNDAPRTWNSVVRLQRKLLVKPLAAKGIDMEGSYPTQDGHVRVGVSTSVAKAQAYFDRTYGPDAIQVHHANPAPETVCD